VASDDSHCCDLDASVEEWPPFDNEHRARIEAYRCICCDDSDRRAMRLLLRLARGTFSADVWTPAPAGGPPVRRHLFDLLAGHRHLLVVGGRWSGKSGLAMLLVQQAAERDLGFGKCIPFFVPASRLEQQLLNEREIVRCNPTIGREAFRYVMEAGRGLVVFDGLDECQTPAALKEGLAALTRAYPASRVVVMTRPLRAKVAGNDETALDGFLKVHLAGPEGAPPGKVYELDEHRSPALRVQRVAEEICRLMDRWSVASLPRGAALGRLTERGRLLVLSQLASTTHAGNSVEVTAGDLVDFLRQDLKGARWFADTEQILHKEEKPRGGARLEDRQGIAEQMVAEIRMHPGVVIEKRPGVFGFADFAFQQFLTAFHMATDDAKPSLVLAEFTDVQHNPGWHDVIVFAAGLGPPFGSKVQARELIFALLEKTAKDSDATFLAARCAEVASFVPATLRAQIDRRLGSVVPPRSSSDVAHLVDNVGDIAAPLLLRALESANANQRACIAAALGGMDYPPALSVLAKLVEDEEKATEEIRVWVWTEDEWVSGQPVGFFAFVAFFDLALHNPTADRRFNEVLARVPRAILDAFVRHVAFWIGRKLDRELKLPQDVEEEERLRDPDRLMVRLEKVARAVHG
jgi:hypothetical protein